MGFGCSVRSAVNAASCGVTVVVRRQRTVNCFSSRADMKKSSRSTRSEHHMKSKNPGLNQAIRFFLEQQKNIQKVEDALDRGSDGCSCQTEQFLMGLFVPLPPVTTPSGSYCRALLLPVPRPAASSLCEHGDQLVMIR